MLIKESNSLKQLIYTCYKIVLCNFTLGNVGEAQLK